jgi:hypothetical protein
VELQLFDLVRDGLVALLPSELGEWHARSHRYGIKVWFGTASKPAREHYEAQVIGARDVPDAQVLALEIGFHAEHPDPAENQRAIAILTRAKKRWTRVIGSEAVAGAFIGRRDDWQRLSETWADPDLSDPDLPMDVATRLADYITALEPVRRA